ncbi:hypothetical protein [Candidatus Spongiihabitans sp.]|uniref:hypothetical protein n=1 Tax=Candidatus Spongiihabitans sp. TaxID=3101308 RepID=UPI003C7A6344
MTTAITAAATMTVVFNPRRRCEERKRRGNPVGYESRQGHNIMVRHNVVRLRRAFFTGLFVSSLILTPSGLA